MRTLICNYKWQFLKTFMYLLIFLLGFSHYTHVFKNNYHKANYYQSWFGPAAKMACGEGYVGFDLFSDKSNPLKKFLRGAGRESQPQSISCSLVNAAPSESIGRQHYSKYLIGAVGLVWRIKGISWKNVYPVPAFLGGISWVAVALIFSIFVSPWFACLLAPIVMYNSLFDEFVIHVRDFSKAPFFLFSIYIFLRLIIEIEKNSLSKKTLVLSSMLGAILGISIGFRGDLKVFVVPFFMITLLILKRFDKKSLLYFVGSIIVFISTFFVFGSPMFTNSNRTYANAHVAILGLADNFDKNLSLDSPSYSKIRRYMDLNGFKRVYIYNDRVSKLAEVRYGKVGFETVGKQLFLDWVKAFPFDFYIRMLKVTWRLIRLPFGEGSFNFVLLPYLSILGVFLGVMYLVSLTVFRSVIISIVVLFLFTFPSLQFDLRHHFQFEPLALLFTLLSLYIPYRFYKLYKGGDFQLQIRRQHIFNATFWFIIIIIVPNILFVLQNRNVRDDVKTLLISREMKEIEYEEYLLNNQFSARFSLEEGPLHLDYLKFVFNLEKCQSSELVLSFNYLTNEPGHKLDFKKRITLRSEELKEGYILAPSFSENGSSIKELAFGSKAELDCLRKIVKIRPSDKIKILPTYYLFRPLEDTDFTYNVRSIFKLAKYFWE